MHRVLIALHCLLLPVIASAADPVGRSIPYQKMYEPLAMVRQADPQGVVVSSLQLQAAQKGRPLPPDLQLELRFGTTRQPIPFDHDGRLTLPLRADLAVGDATVWINQLKSVVVIRITFTARLPPAPSTSYGRLMESLSVMKRIIKQQAGMMSFMAPSLQGVELDYAVGTVQTATVGTGALAKTWRSDAHGSLRIPFDPAMPANTPVVLSALPLSVLPYPL